MAKSVDYIILIMRRNFLFCNVEDVTECFLHFLVCRHNDSNIKQQTINKYQVLLFFIFDQFPISIDLLFIFFF